MKTSLYVPKIQRVEVTLTFLVSHLPDDVTEGQLYDVLEHVAKNNEGEFTIDGRTCSIVLESGHVLRLA